MFDFLVEEVWCQYTLQAWTAGCNTRNSTLPRDRLGAFIRPRSGEERIPLKACLNCLCSLASAGEASTLRRRCYDSEKSWG